MKHLIVLLAFCAVGLAAPETRSVAYGEFWPSLAEMTPDERANAEIWLEPLPGSGPEAYDETRAISTLWNCGEYEAALERARSYSRHGNPGEVAVAVSPRKLVECDPGFGPDIRIGERDSLYGCSFDRLNNGWLFASFPARAGNRTYLYSYRSTDNGSTWTELASFSWNYADYVRTTAAACHGDYLVITIAIRGLSSHRCFTTRLSTTTGEVVPYPGDTVFIQVLESTPGDTIVELAAASSEDGNPGGTIYLFGRTSAGLLKYAWTDSSARGWRERNTGVTTGCDNGLDCAYNQGYTSKYIWASWMRHYGGDTARLHRGYWEAGNPDFEVDISTNSRGIATDYPVPTSITAYRDTILIGYVYRGSKLLRTVYCYDCNGGSWYTSSLTDSSVVRQVIEVSGRRGGGFAAAYRNHSSSHRRDLLFRYAGRAGGPYTEPDTVSGLGPEPAARIRVEKLDSGEYGTVWVTSGVRPNKAAFFSRVSLTGIEEPAFRRPVLLGLQALPRPGGVRLMFENHAAGPVRLRLFDRAGRLVLVREKHMPASRQAVEAAPRESGVYFAVVEAGGRRASTKFAFAR